MPLTPTTIGFADVTFASELKSLQRYLASLFTVGEIRASFSEGAFLTRPYMLLNLVTAVPQHHNSYVSFYVSDYVINYYATDDADCLAAMEKLAGLEIHNRVPVWDYDTAPTTPTQTVYDLRLSAVNVDRLPDLEDDKLWSVNCSLKVEGKRSPDKYTGDILSTLVFTS